MNDYFLFEADLVHNEVGHVLDKAVGVHEAVRHTDDHFLHLYVEVQHLFVGAGHLFAVARHAVV